jgi:release factor glutamine methyltransferase
MSIPFKVNSTVFIPRPETELLVEQIIDISKRRWEDEKAVNILDIGTGCGNIAISFAKYINNSHIFAIDVSDDILKIAEENAQMNSVGEKITFKKLSIFDAEKTDFENINIVASNPPYISLKDYQNLEDEVRHYEPEICLQDYNDGLSFFKIICEKSKEWLIDNGFLFMEMGLGESQDVYEIVKSYGFSNIKILKDYQQIDRVIFCENEK